MCSYTSFFSDCPESSLKTIPDQGLDGTNLSFEENSSSAVSCSAESPRLGDCSETDGHVEDNSCKSKKSKLDSGTDSGEIITKVQCPRTTDKINAR
jgi:hypothetical protein